MTFRISLVIASIIVFVPQRALAWSDTTFSVPGAVQPMADCRLILRGARIGTSQYLANLLFDNGYGTGAGGAFRFGAGGLNLETNAANAAAASTTMVDAVSVTALQNNCGLTQVSNLTQEYDGTNFADITIISLKFRAVLPVGKSAYAAAGAVAGDGGTYDFVYSMVAADANSVPVLTATVTAVVANTAPVITGGATAAVNAAENQTAVTNVATTDDNDSEGSGLTYSFTTDGGRGADNGLFNLDASTGVVTFKLPPDFENPASTNAPPDNIYDVQVTVTDSGNLKDTQDITVTVTDVVEDTTDPRVAIEGAPVNHDGVTPFTVTVRFSEAITGFVDGELTATNATVGPLNPAGGAGMVFTATITPASPQDIVLDVASNVAKDAEGNDNEAAPTVTVGSTIVEDTKMVIGGFMNNRANHILGNQPGIIGFVSGSNNKSGGPAGNLALNANVSSMNLAFATSLNRVMSKADKRIANAFPNDEEGVASSTSEFAMTRNFDVWTQIYGSTSRAGTSDSNLWVGYFGAHYFISPDLLVGGLVQVDWADETNSAVNSNADGTGWMIGPYLAGRIPGQNVYYEARASWGRSDNSVSPIGTYTDSFETERWMASAKISGDYKMGDVAIKPEASISWFEETQESYTDSLANFIPSQTLSLGEARFGPNFVRTVKLDDGTILQPSFGVSGVWNFGIANNSASQGFALGDNDLRARVDGGLTFTNSLGWILAATGFYDGLGINDYEAYGGSLRLTIPVN